MVFFSQIFEEYKGFRIIFVNFYLPLKQKRHICLRFEKQLKPAKEFGRSVPENIYDPIYQYRSIRKEKVWFDIDIHIVIRYQHYLVSNDKYIHIKLRSLSLQ